MHLFAVTMAEGIRRELCGQAFCLVPQFHPNGTAQVLIKGMPAITVLTKTPLRHSHSGAHFAVLEVSDERPTTRTTDEVGLRVVTIGLRGVQRLEQHVVGRCS